MLPKVAGGQVTLCSEREGRVFNQFRRHMTAGPRAATPAYKPFRLYFLIAIDPPSARQAEIPYLRHRVRYGHLPFLTARQKLALIQDSTFFPVHTTSSCVPNADELSPSRSL
jgi:hypothetical protein